MRIGKGDIWFLIILSSSSLSPPLPLLLLIIRLLDLYFKKEEAYANSLSISLVTEIQNLTAKLSLLREKGRALETTSQRGVLEKIINCTAGKCSTYRGGEEM